MRLANKGGEQPLDKYVRFKNDISLWYQEMKEYGLNEDEITVLEPHLLHLYGIADTQETVMEISIVLDARLFPRIEMRLLHLHCKAFSTYPCLYN